MSSSADYTIGLPGSHSAPLPDLVTSALAGDRGAWHNLVERFKPLVKSVIRKFGLTKTDSEDVQQTVWLHLMTHLKQVREPKALPGWISTTTRNEALRVIAMQRRVQHVDPQEDRRIDQVDLTDPTDDLIRSERRTVVHEGLRGLRSEHREMMLLLFADAKVSYRQVSSRLGIPVGSIGPTRARCLNQLSANTAIRALSPS
jgi:RNA polymerase sigma factor (sigma-70 family)